MATPIRVLVVDDSAFARKVIADTLRVDSHFEVVGIARDGLEALEKIVDLTPDVVTLDLVMPNLDGLGVLRALPLQNRPRVVIVSMNDVDSELGIAALREGAFDLIHKPTAIATDRLYDLAEELVIKVKAAGAAKPAIAFPVEERVAATSVPAKTARSILVIGASTGGPQALTHLLRSLPATFPIPIALVLHIPPGYTAAFAARLNDECALHVVEAEEDLEIAPGMAVVARAGVHLKLRRHGAIFRATLDVRPTGAMHSPSVDVLFESVASQGAGVVAVVLTGMGDDGLIGARAIHAAGGTILNEAESTCVVYGMPRSVAEAGLSSAEVPLPDMAAAILKQL